MWGKGRAYRFIFLMGFVSLLSDFTYEGAKGIIGPYLAFLGASAFTVSFISGLSELAGYWLRLLGGFLSDRLRLYWGFTLFGYALNLLSVPLLGFAKSWQFAGLLVFLERAGKGIRTPSRDTLLSQATAQVGHGKGFGLHEFLDQLGALSGPLAVSLVLFLGFGYQTAFLFLFLPALLALSLLLYAKNLYQNEVSPPASVSRRLEVKSGFYAYLFASFLVGLGFLQFPLIGYYMEKGLGLSSYQVALLFALAMAVDALSALFFGYLFDRAGFYALVLGLLPGIFAAPLLLYFNQPHMAVLLWGIAMGVQESIMRSAVAKLSSASARGSAYGLFHFFYGASLFMGGLLAGMLYEYSLNYLILFSVIAQLLGVLILLKIKLPQPS